MNSNNVNSIINKDINSNELYKILKKFFDLKEFEKWFNSFLKKN